MDALGDLCRRHQLTGLEGVLESRPTFAEEKPLNIAGLGRFKAGKSSISNHLLVSQVLPVGVIPVTTVVTESWIGHRQRAGILFRDGRTEAGPVERIGEFVADSGNPGNRNRVARVWVQLPARER